MGSRKRYETPVLQKIQLDKNRSIAKKARKYMKTRHCKFSKKTQKEISAISFMQMGKK